MSIFIAMLAFSDEGAAKLGVLPGSVVAALLGLSWGQDTSGDSVQGPPPKSQGERH
jgi:Na+/H+ antiporter NhaA